jgi:large subunit ribosomal protein L29
MAKDLAKLREMSPRELAAEEAALRDEIWKLRLQRAAGALQDARKIQRTRHALARVLTVLQQKTAAPQAR